MEAFGGAQLTALRGGFSESQILGKGGEESPTWYHWFGHFVGMVGDGVERMQYLSLSFDPQALS